MREPTVGESVKIKPRKSPHRKGGPGVFSRVTSSSNDDKKVYWIQRANGNGATIPCYREDFTLDRVSREHRTAWSEALGQVTPVYKKVKRKGN